MNQLIHRLLSRLPNLKKTSGKEVFLFINRARCRTNLKVLYRAYVLLPEWTMFNRAKLEIKQLYQHNILLATQLGLELKSQVENKKKRKEGESKLDLGDYDLPQ